jgi:hypothetical protein
MTSGISSSNLSLEVCRSRPTCTSNAGRRRSRLGGWLRPFCGQLPRLRRYRPNLNSCGAASQRERCSPTWQLAHRVIRLKSSSEPC